MNSYLCKLSKLRFINEILLRCIKGRIGRSLVLMWTTGNRSSNVKLATTQMVVWVVDFRIWRYLTLTMQSPTKLLMKAWNLTRYGEKHCLGENLQGIFLVGLFLICIGHQEKQAETTERDIWDYLLHLQYRRVETIEKECVCNGRLENVRWTTLAKTRLWVSTGQNKLVWFRHKFGQNNELRRANFKTFFTLKIL